MGWEIDPAHTMVEFGVRHMLVSTVKGRFTKFSGTIHMDEDNPTQSRVEASIDVSSIDTGDEQRDAHLRSPDFFDVARFPNITFKSRRIEGLEGDAYRVVGDLTIRDVTREVVLDVTYAGKAKDPWGNLRAGFTAETTINRKDFGLTWNVPLEAGGWLVGDKVRIMLEVQAVQKAEVPLSASA